MFRRLVLEGEVAGERERELLRGGGDLSSRLPFDPDLEPDLVTRGLTRAAGEELAPRAHGVVASPVRGAPDMSARCSCKLVSCS